MIFRRVEPSPEYRSLRLLSEAGRWELGLCAYHSGTRLRMGLIGRPPSLLDFCLGHDTQIYSPVLLAVMERLKPAPESASTAEIDALFPWAGTRPDLSIHLKPLLSNTGRWKKMDYGSAGVLVSGEAIHDRRNGLDRLHKVQP